VDESEGREDDSLNPGINFIISRYFEIQERTQKGQFGI
jgi:hypothetical protein